MVVNTDELGFLADNEGGEANTPRDLARLLRRLRRRHARARCDTPLTYRELASKTGWALGVISDYFTGKTLPSTDRFDVLVQLLGATPAEQGALASIRDRVEESQRGLADRRRAAASIARPRAGSEPGPAVPWQVPSPAWQLVGRTAELPELTTLARGVTAVGGPAAICAITGAAGIGKTALVLSWARQVTDLFPNGQLYADLRGFDLGHAPVPPAEVIGGFLVALGTPPQLVPGGLDARAALYRTLLAGKRMLVVLDNAADAEQVRPALPAAPGCMAVVTSRNDLASLVSSEGARVLTLDLLSQTEARELLCQRLGAARIAAESGATDDIVARCGRLPLALAIVAARAAIHPDFPLTVYATELGDARLGLDALSSGDPAADVRSVFSWSMRRISAPAVRLFRLLGVSPAVATSVTASASLAGLPASRVRELLAELTRAHLVIEPQPGRYALHDLLRAFAAEQAHREGRESDRDVAVRRLLDHYLHTTYAGNRLLYPARDPIAVTPPLCGVTPERLTDRQSAWAWFAREHAVLLAITEHAVAAGFDRYVFEMAWALSNFLDWNGNWHEQATVQGAALSAAKRMADAGAEAIASRALGRTHIHLRQLKPAQTHLRHALNLLTRIGDEAGQAHCHSYLGQVYEMQGRYAEAMDHVLRGLDLYRAVGNEMSRAAMLGNLGLLRARLGDFEEAVTSCQRAITIHERLGNRYGLAGALHCLGSAYSHFGRFDEAVDCYRRALGLYPEFGDRLGEAECLTELGGAHEAAGRYGAARDPYQRALDILDELNHPDADRVRARLRRLGRGALSAARTGGGMGGAVPGRRPGTAPFFLAAEPPYGAILYARRTVSSTELPA